MSIVAQADSAEISRAQAAHTEALNQYYLEMKKLKNPSTADLEALKTKIVAPSETRMHDAQKQNSIEQIKVIENQGKKSQAEVEKKVLKTVDDMALKPELKDLKPEDFARASQLARDAMGKAKLGNFQPAKDALPELEKLRSDMANGEINGKKIPDQMKDFKIPDNLKLDVTKAKSSAGTAPTRGSAAEAPSAPAKETLILDGSNIEKEVEFGGKKSPGQKAAPTHKTKSAHP